MDFILNEKRLAYPENILISVPKNIGQLTITWDAITNFDVAIIDKVGYNIYRSTTPNGIFYKLNRETILINRYDDCNITKNPNINYWYKVSTIAFFKDKTQTESKLSEAVIFAISNNNNRWFKKINERNMWILKMDGVLMDLYTRKIDGPKCPVCFNDFRTQAGDSNCTTCFGTGIEGGYEPMFQLYVRQKPAPQDLQLNSEGQNINSSPGAWTLTNIPLHNRDILINPRGIMYSITNVNISHAAGYMFHQELQLKELDETDIRYKIARKTLYPKY